MRSFTRWLAVGAVAGLGTLAGCSSGGSDGDYSSRRSSDTYDVYDRSDRLDRYDRSPNRYDRYDTAERAGSSRPPRIDADGNLHHPPGWKAASDRGRLSNDRDARFDRD